MKNPKRKKKNRIKESQGLITRGADKLVFQGTSYACASGPTEFVTFFQEGKSGAYKFIPDDCEQAMNELVQACESHHVDPRRVFKSMFWICTRCSQVLKRDISYLFWAKDKPSVPRQFDGWTSTQAEIERFFREKSCPKCGNKEFAFITPITECQPSHQVLNESHTSTGIAEQLKEYIQKAVSEGYWPKELDPEKCALIDLASVAKRITGYVEMPHPIDSMEIELGMGEDVHPEYFVKDGKLLRAGHLMEDIKLCQALKCLAGQKMNPLDTNNICTMAYDGIITSLATKLAKWVLVALPSIYRHINELPMPAYEEIAIAKHKAMENILFEIYTELSEGETIDEAKISGKLIKILNDHSPVPVQTASWSSNIRIKSHHAPFPSKSDIIAGHHLITSPAGVSPPPSVISKPTTSSSAGTVVVKRVKSWERFAWVPVVLILMGILIPSFLVRRGHVPPPVDSVDADSSDSINPKDVGVQTTLRSKPEGNLTVTEVKSMLRSYNFYCREGGGAEECCNPKGAGIQNNYEKQSRHGVEVVVDHASGLVWQQSGSGNYMNYKTANKYVDRLNQDTFAGYHDWRLPTLEEAMSLMEPTGMKGDLYIDPLFDQKQQWIWTSDGNSASSAWVVYFSYGFCSLYIFDSYFYVRAVR